jgi:hemin uptake protein HemP
VTITSDELFAGRQEIQICHAGECYRLRITRSGKLILHK